MQYKIFKDGIKLSRLGMGVMRLPVKGDQSEIDYKKAKAVIDMAMERESITMIQPMFITMEIQKHF